MLHRRFLIAALALLVSVSYGALFYGFSVLITEEAAGGRFSTALLSAAYGGAVLTSGAAAIAVGRIADRAGVRAILALGSLVGALGLVAFTAAGEPWHVLAVWWCLLGPAMAMTFYEPAYVAIQQWFDPDERPRAIATLTLAAGLSGPVFLPATAALVGVLGWRDAGRVLALILAVVGTGAAMLFVPSGPGASPRHDDSGAHVRLGARVRAFRQPRLLVFTLGSFLVYGSLEASVIHRVARFEESGFPLAEITSWAAISGLLTLPGRFVLPVLGRRARGTRVLAGVLLVMALATAFAIPGDERWQMGAYFCLFGLVFGAALPLRAVIMSHWHAVAGFGTIMGIQTAAIALSRAGGPPAIGALRDGTGTYRLAMLVLALLFGVGAWLVFASERLRA